MKIAITGYNGFIGSNLSRFLTDNGDVILPIARNILYNDQNRVVEIVEESDAIIHLSGYPIIGRWTTAKKRAIYESRIKTTENIYKALVKSSRRPKVVLLASAVGIYSNEGVHDESSIEFDNGFLGKVVIDWESFASEISKLGVRVVTMRFGIVLGKGGGAIEQLIRPFRFFAGGKIGSGNQPFPFIHIDDLNRGVELMLNNNYTGVVNFVSPKIVTNKMVTETIGKVMNRPSFLTVPEFALRLIYGKSAILLTEGQRVEPGVLKKLDFRFKFGDFEKAVSDILNK